MQEQSDHQHPRAGSCSLGSVWHSLELRGRMCCTRCPPQAPPWAGCSRRSQDVPAPRGPLQRSWLLPAASRPPRPRGSTKVSAPCSAPQQPVLPQKPRGKVHPSGPLLAPSPPELGAGPALRNTSPSTTQPGKGVGSSSWVPVSQQLTGLCLVSNAHQKAHLTESGDRERGEKQPQGLGAHRRHRHEDSAGKKSQVEGTRQEEGLSQPGGRKQTPKMGSWHLPGPSHDPKGPGSNLGTSGTWGSHLQSQPSATETFCSHSSSLFHRQDSINPSHPAGEQRRLLPISARKERGYRVACL